MNSLKHITSALKEAQDGLAQLMGNEATLSHIHHAAELMSQSLQKGHRIFSCGNGGSMCDAMHFAEELTGRYRQNRPAFAASAISDPGFISCTANDFGYEFIFSRYLEAHGRPGDVLLAISTSGTSKNVMKAAEFAKSNQINVIALTGKPTCALGDLAHVHVATPAGSFADRVQELHIKVIHIWIELIERTLAPENYKI